MHLSHSPYPGGLARNEPRQGSSLYQQQPVLLPLTGMLRAYVLNSKDLRSFLESPVDFSAMTGRHWHRRGAAPQVWTGHLSGKALCEDVCPEHHQNVGVRHLM